MALYIFYFANIYVQCTNITSYGTEAQKDLTTFLRDEILVPLDKTLVSRIARRNTLESQSAVYRSYFERLTWTIYIPWLTHDGTIRFLESRMSVRQRTTVDRRPQVQARLTKQQP